jgi:DNA repair protein RadC
VHPREVFRPAIITRSASIIVLHNHPSGSTEPSEADIQLTSRLKDAGKILGYEISDHIIFDAGRKYKSIL